MTDLPLHPKLVHLPIALSVLMPFLSASVLLAIWRGWFPRRVWTLVLLGQLALFASGLLAMRSGEGDAERVERVVPEAAVEAHEEAAETFVWGSGAVLALALLTLLLRPGRAAHVVGLGTVVGTAVVLGLGYAVGQAGGELVYRHGAAAAFANGALAAPGIPAMVPGGRERDDDHR